VLDDTFRTRVTDPALITALGAIVFAFLIAEALRAAANERGQFARGGIEPDGDVYRWMKGAYPAAFLAMLIEGAVGAAPPPAAAIAGAVVFAAAKMLKWWAIVSLGPAWTFRVIVVPGAPLVAAGPYRYLRHPNYLGVVGELVGVALMTGATFTGPAATMLFGLLIVRRIAVENRALDAILRRVELSTAVDRARTEDKAG
jgi:methyltransferase